MQKSELNSAAQKILNKYELPDVCKKKFNLMLSSGGLKTFYRLGFIYGLIHLDQKEKLNLTDQIKKIGGSSCGAIGAVLVKTYMNLTSEGKKKIL